MAAHGEAYDTVKFLHPQLLRQDSILGTAIYVRKRLHGKSAKNNSTLTCYLGKRLQENMVRYGVWAKKSSGNLNTLGNGVRTVFDGEDDCDAIQ